MPDSARQVDTLEIFSDPNRYLKMEITPQLPDAESRQSLEDEIRREIRRLNAEVGVVVLPDKVASLIVMMDLQSDLLNNPQEKLFRLAQTIFGSSDCADGRSRNSKHRKRGPSRIRHALVSGAADARVSHTLAWGELRFRGELKALKTRIVDSGAVAASEHTIIGISRDSKVRLQFRNSSGRCFWATLKAGNFDVAELNSALDKIYPKRSVTIPFLRDDSRGHEIQAADLVASLLKGNG